MNTACKTYFDNLQSIVATQSLAKEATHQVYTPMVYLGLQDATSKRRPISQTTGEWTGYITLSLEAVGLFIMVSEKKWNKAKEMIAKILSHFDSYTDRNYFFLKETEQKTGFMVHLAIAYSLSISFLIGLYIAMNLWRLGQD